MRRTGRLISTMAAGVAMVTLGAGPAAAATPGATVTPSTGLVDGQSVHVVESGFFSFAGRPGTFTPSVLQCDAAAFPGSASFQFDQQILDELNARVTGQCVALGQFAVGVSTLDVAVHATITPPSGAPIACDRAPGACAVVVTGVTSPPEIGWASVPISFAPETPASPDDCRKDGWRSLADGEGSAFRNQGQCVAWAVRTAR